MILSVIQQNQEFKDLLLEQNKIIIELSKIVGSCNNDADSGKCRTRHFCAQY